MALNLDNVMAGSAKYKEVLDNTTNYRKEWSKSMEPLIQKTLKAILKKTKLPAEIVVNDQIDNLHAILFDLGSSASGINENLENTNIKRMMVKNNGSIIYQQLFNGKVMVMILAPSIEGYGEPKPPRPIEILRPEELTAESIARNVEEFLAEITLWEDYDDNKIENKAPFNPIGFQTVAFEEGV